MILKKYYKHGHNTITIKFTLKQCHGPIGNIDIKITLFTDICVMPWKLYIFIQWCDDMILIKWYQNYMPVPTIP